jgi:hypothetical protein
MMGVEDGVCLVVCEFAREVERTAGLCVFGECREKT